MNRFHKFNKFLLIDAGIGSTLGDLDVHLDRIARYIRLGDKNKAGTEIQNLRQCVSFIQEETSPQYSAFAALIKKIDGTEITDISDDTLISIVKMLEDVDVGELNKKLSEIKKKLGSELQTYFPKIFLDAETKEYFDRVKRRSLFILDGLISNRMDEKELEKLTDSVVLFKDPLSFTGSSSAEIESDRQYEDACLLLSQSVNRDAKLFTVMEYYNALLYLEKQNKRNKKH